jgi:type II secretory pathway component PulF
MNSLRNEAAFGPNTAIDLDDAMNVVAKRFSRPDQIQQFTSLMARYEDGSPLSGSEKEASYFHRHFSPPVM